MKKFLALAVIAASMAGSSTAARAAVTLLNSGFESPEIADGQPPANGPGYVVIPAGDPNFGWTVGGTSVDVVRNHFSPQNDVEAYEGQQYLDLNGTPGPGSISQNFASVAGQSYNLAFAYSHNPGNPAITAASAIWTIYDATTEVASGSFSHDSTTDGDGSFL